MIKELPCGAAMQTCRIKVFINKANGAAKKIDLTIIISILTLCLFPSVTNSVFNQIEIFCKIICIS